MIRSSSTATENESRVTSGPVLLFDGECGLCNRIVRLLLRWDEAGRLRFAPLQGASAQEYLRVHGLPTANFDTLILVPAWAARNRAEFLVRTSAVIAALRAIGDGRARTLAGILSVIPRPLRDAGYRVVGRLRYRIFGPWRPKPLPRPEWAERFLA